MRSFGNLSAWSRRAFVALTMTGMVGASASVAFAQDPAPAAQQAAPPDTLKFTSDVAAILYLVKPDKVAEFETVWKTVRSKVEASDKAELKALFSSLKIHRVMPPPNTPADAPATFIFFC